MKNIIVSILIICLIAMNGLFAAEPEGLTKIRSKYKAGLDKLVNRLTELQAKNAIETLEKLKGLDKKLQTSGDLKNLVALRKLLKDLKPEGVSSLPQSMEEVKELVHALSIKDDKAFDEYSTTLKKFQASYQEALKRRITFYTQKNEIDTALAFQAEFDSLNGSVLDDVAHVKPVTKPREKPVKSVARPIIKPVARPIIKPVTKPREKPVKSVTRSMVDKNKSHILTMSASKGAPVVNGEDIANYSKVTLADKWWESSGERKGNRAKGQTFTTKSANAYLKAFTFQVNSEHKAEGVKSYVIRVGKVSENTTKVIFTGTATQDFTWNSGEYMTWSLSEALLLSANTLYSIDIEMSKSTSDWKTGIPYLNCSDNNYTGGHYYYYLPNTNKLIFIDDKDKRQRLYDRIFHLDLALTK